MVLEVTAPCSGRTRRTFAVETHDRGFAGEPATRRGWTPPFIGVLDEIVGDDVVKLLVRHRDLDPDGLLEAARGWRANRRVHPFQQIGAARDLGERRHEAATLARMAARHGSAPTTAPSNDEDASQ